MDGTWQVLALQYTLTLAVCIAALVLAAVCTLLLWRRRQKNAPAQAVSEAEHAGASAEWGGGEPPRRQGKALPRLLAGSLVLAVVCGLCLLTGAVQSPWAETFHLSQRGGATYVTYGPRLLPQSAFGPELDPVRDIIAEQFETFPPWSSLSPSTWSELFETRGEVEALLGFSLPDNSYLEEHASPGGGLLPPWGMGVLGTEDGQIIHVFLSCRMYVDDLPLLVNLFLYTREALKLDGEQTVYEYQVEELFQTAGGRRAFFPVPDGSKATAVLPWDGISFSLVTDDTPEGREMLRRVLDGFS